MVYYNCIIRQSSDSKEDEITIRVNRHQRRNIIFELRDLMVNTEPYVETEEKSFLFSPKEIVYNTIYERNKLVWIDDLDIFLNLDNIASIRFEKIVCNEW